MSPHGGARIAGGGAGDAVSRRPRRATNSDCLRRRSGGQDSAACPDQPESKQPEEECQRSEEPPEVACVAHHRSVRFHADRKLSLRRPRDPKYASFADPEAAYPTRAATVRVAIRYPLATDRCHVVDLDRDSRSGEALVAGRGAVSRREDHVVPLRKLQFGRSGRGGHHELIGELLRCIVLRLHRESDRAAGGADG